MFSQTRATVQDKGEEARIIVETAEQLGLQLTRNKGEILEIVKDRLLKGNI